jgi:ribulose 1,5-bisphosphate synthetase/thiazole synthase
MGLPLIAETDLLVIGAGLAGMVLAENRALAGDRVLLIERRTYPGFEIGSWYRPWVYWKEQDAKLLRHWLPLENINAAEGEEKAFSLDKCKVGFENTLLDAGVRLLYALQPVALREEADGFHFVVGAKSGLYEIITQCIVDATGIGLSARLSSSYPTIETICEGEAAAVRCVEVHGLQISDLYIPIPERFGIQKNRVILHPSDFAPENRILELVFSQDWIPAPAGKNLPYREGFLRIATLKVCEFLFSLPRWEQVRFGAASAESMPLRDFDISSALLAGFKLEKALALGHKHLCAIYGSLTDFTEEPTVLSEDSNLSLHCGLAQPLAPEDTRWILSAARREPERDVFVCGAGVCGATCAYAASDSGEPCSVVAADMNDIPGGTGTAGGIHYYWYGHRQGFTRDIDDEYEKMCQRLHQKQEFYIWGVRDSWNPELKGTLLWERMIGQRIVLLTGSIACGVFRQGDTVTGVLLATPQGPRIIRARVTVDATGDADLAVLAGASAVEGNEKDNMIMWANMAQFKQAGLYRGGTFTSTVDVGDIEDYTRFILLNRRRGDPCHDHGSYIGTRESRHLQGEYQVNLRDIVSLRQYPDTILTCFSNFDTKGKSWADLVYFGFLPSQLEADIPYRSVLPPDLEGLLVGGKAFSCTHDASSGLRMQDDMQNLGGAIGIAAAMGAKSGVRNIDMAQLQQQLMVKGIIMPGHIPNMEMRQESVSQEFAELIEKLTGEEMFQNIDMGVNMVCRNISPIVQICLAPSTVVLPFLRAAYDTAQKKRRLLLARLLLWHRDDLGTPLIIAEIENMLESEFLPRRQGSITFCQVYPDHGVMAEVSYLVCLLARSGNETVGVLLKKLALRIRDAHRDYKDRHSCVFSHIESIAYVTCRRPHESLMPAINILLSLPEFHGIEEPIEGWIKGVNTPMFNPDIVPERVAYLRILVAEAAARCGSKNGYTILQGFLLDNRHILARSAARILGELLKVDSRNNDALATAVLPLGSYQPYQVEIW